jgi:alanine dehydrogenase
MVIGVPKEIKPEENRIAIVPGGVETIVQRGHKVIIERGAGSGSGFSDEEYSAAGAQVLDKREDIFAGADLVLKVKEPLLEEYEFLKAGQIVFTYFHLAASEELTRNLMKRKIVGIAYETVQTEDGFLPLLFPMSEIAGRMAPQEGAKYLEETYGGRGILLGGVAGVPPGNVVILGGGTVGYNAARIALGMGASVTVLDINPRRLRMLDETFQGRITTMIADNYNLRMVIGYADLLIGAVLIPGAKAPKLITKEMLKAMRKGAVLVDVSVDQGGCAETSRPTIHSNPVYEEEGIIHYAVSNMPGAVPRTSTRALTLNTLPYVLDIADLGWKEAARKNSALAMGINLAEGNITYKAVADAFNIPYTPLKENL